MGTLGFGQEAGCHCGGRCGVQVSLARERGVGRSILFGQPRVVYWSVVGACVSFCTGVLAVLAFVCGGLATAGEKMLRVRLAHGSVLPFV